jgi:NAD(P)-dependent dehydrogenase (short-subunit alcohol dehydrogenase family)
MTQQHAGRIAIVTGASRGIGLAITRALSAEGTTVYAGDRNVSAELAALDNVRPVELDLAQPDGPSQLVAAAGPRINLLVNNVGSANPRPGGFASVTDEQWERSLTLNLMTAVRATRAALPALIAGAPSSIVTISSVNATLADPLVIDYCAAKSALSSFCKALAKEIGGQGVRINTVSPGPVATDLWLGEHGVAQTVGAATGSDPAAVAEAAAKSMVTGRFTTPDEVAAAVLFLASDQAANITGADIRIDGNLIPTWP